MSFVYQENWGTNECAKKKIVCINNLHSFFWHIYCFRSGLKKAFGQIALTIMLIIINSLMPELNVPTNWGAWTLILLLFLKMIFRYVLDFLFTPSFNILWLIAFAYMNISFDKWQWEKKSLKTWCLQRIFSRVQVLLGIRITAFLLN